MGSVPASRYDASALSFALVAQRPTAHVSEFPHFATDYCPIKDLTQTPLLLASSAFLIHSRFQSPLSFLAASSWPTVSTGSPSAIDVLTCAGSSTLETSVAITARLSATLVSHAGLKLPPDCVEMTLRRNQDSIHRLLNQFKTPHASKAA